MENISKNKANLSKNLTNKTINDIGNEIGKYSIERVLNFRKRFVASNIDLSTIRDPIISEDKTAYAFEGCNNNGLKNIVFNGKMIVKDHVKEIKNMFFLKGTNIPVIEFIADEIIVRGINFKNALCCAVGNKIIGPLDALQTYRYEDLGNKTFMVVYINLDLDAMVAIIDENGNEKIDKKIPQKVFDKIVGEAS